MKSYSTVVLASILSAAYAAPAATDGCDAAVVTSTVTCSTIVTTITTTDACVAQAPVTVTVPAEAPANTTPAVDAANGVNVQSFTGALAGISAPAVVSAAGARPFTVNGDTFVGSGAALGRSCDVQHNQCANAANSGKLDGGVSVCDQQNDECHNFNSVNAKLRALKHRSPLVPRALNFGTCSDPTIIFKAGLDGRNTDAFIANDQTDFNHGSALNIAVIAGFICQRLGSPCKADAAAQSACSAASQAAVATSQDQAAADVFNSMLAGGTAIATTTAAAAVTTAAPTLASAATSDLVAQTGIVVSTIVSCS
ncbi:hypothetical protein GQ53DRAFT_763707 [Thozetella sp. PMI_491]|nr:hypothetical protein GQ53DRAFT_763707 [Thozetella sp. PMI_491]